MIALFQITLINASCATVLALAVALAGRYLKRPAVLHTLWILVLLQLFMPPVLEIGLLPGPAPLRLDHGTGESMPVSIEPPGSRSTAEIRPTDAVLPPIPEPTAAVPTPAVSPAPGEVVTTLWIAGSVWMLGLILLRTGRFRRLLRTATVEDAALERRLTRLAKRMKVPKPGLRLVHASISPLIHPRLGGAELLFPAKLLSRLDAGEQEAILAHELAHVARRDHWVRLLELIAVLLFWWHPAVWWARSRLRRVEERCCDQLVMRTLPHRRPSYARGLLKTVEFLAGRSAGVPALASGVGEARDLKERLTMILKDRPPKSMSMIQRSLLALCAASVLLIFPTWSDSDLQAATSDDVTQEKIAVEDALQAAEREYVNQRLELEQQAIELEYALREIRERQAELEYLWQSEMRAEGLSRTETDASRARAVERYERARRLERLEARESRMRDAELEQHLQEMTVTREAERIHLERERLQSDLDRLRAESFELREEGRTELAEEIEAEIELLRERNAEERVRQELEFRRMLEELEHERSGRRAIVR